MNGDTELQPTLVDPTSSEAARIRLAAALGAVLGLVTLWLLPGFLWTVEEWLKPGPPTDLERSAMALSVLGLMIMAVLVGPPLGAAVAAAWAARRMRLPRVAGRWCVTAGGITTAVVTVLCLLGGDPLDQIGMALLPWRAGHLLYALLVTGWGIHTLRASSASWPSSG